MAGVTTRRERGGDREDRRGPEVRVVRKARMLDAVQARCAETGRLVICYSGAMFGAGGGGQRPDQLALELAGEACVIHVNPLNPMSVQVPVRDVVLTNNQQARAWLEELEAPHKLFYSCYPTAQCWEWLGVLDESWRFWYDCVDDWANFDTNAWWHEQRERNIARRADVVTATARLLEARCRGWGADALFLPNSTRLLAQPVPQDVKPEFDLIFCGTMSDNWLDWELIEALLAEGFSICLVGRPPQQGKPLRAHNLDWAGVVPNEELRAVLATGRVGIVPFRDLPLVHAVWPIKYADYLAAGLATVAAYIPELDGADFCTVTYSQKDFIRACHSAMAETPTPTEIMLAAEQHTAAARVATVLPLLEEVSAW